MKAEEPHFKQTALQKIQDVFQAEWKWYKMEFLFLGRRE